METVYYISIPESFIDSGNPSSWPSRHFNGYVKSNNEITLSIFHKEDFEEAKKELEEKKIPFTTFTLDFDEEGWVYI